VVKPEVSTETPPVTETPPDVVQPPDTNEEFLKLLNEKFNQTFESDDQIKEAFTKPTMELEYKEAQEKYDDLQGKYELLTEQLDPKSYFSSEEAMKLEVWKTANPTKDASVAQKVFSTEDLTAVSDLEMVKMGRKFSNPKLPGTDADLEAAIAEEFNVDPDTPFKEWPTNAQIRLSTSAAEYRDRFDSIKKGVTLPERVNIEELRTQRQQEAATAKEQLTESWNGHSTQLSETMKQLKVPVGVPKEGEEQSFLTWDLSADVVKDVQEMASGYIAMGVKYDDQTKGLFDRAVTNILIEKNLPSMLDAYGKDLLARQKEQHLEETNNTAPLTDTQKSTPGSEEQKKAEQTEFATQGYGSNVRSKPLFNIKKE